MAVAVGDVWRVQIAGSCFGQRIRTNLGYILTEVVGVVGENALTTAFVNTLHAGAGGGDILETAYLEMLPPDYLMEYFEVQMIRPIRLAYARQSRAVPGQHVSTTETANQAVCITRKSDFAGRWAQSNLHIGPIPQGATVQDNGNVTAAYKAKMEIFGGATLTPIISLGCTFQPCIIHPVAEHGGTTPLLYNVPQLTIRTMRRRTLRVGE